MLASLFPASRPEKLKPVRASPIIWLHGALPHGKIQPHTIVEEMGQRPPLTSFPGVEDTQKTRSISRERSSEIRRLFSGCQLIPR